MIKEREWTAFPTQYGDLGMTLRDYFAAAALPLVAGGHTPVDIAYIVYTIADAMLAERKK